MPTERVAALQEMPCGSGAWSPPPGLLAFALPHSTSEFRAGDLQPILAAMMPVTHRRKRRLFVVSDFLPQRSKALLTSG